MLEVRIPEVGESVTEVQIAAWLKEDGDYVETDEPIAEIDSDKASFELPAPAAGVLKIKAAEGDIVKVGDVVALIDEAAESDQNPAPQAEPAPADVSADVPTSPPAPAEEKKHPSPAAEALMTQAKLTPQDVEGTGREGRITKADVQRAMAEKAAAEASVAPLTEEPPTVNVPPLSGVRERRERRERMSMLRRTIARRLMEAKQNTAMLTTFNEIDMKAVMALRKQYKEAFQKKYGVKLGFMSFFSKAVCEALKEWPAVNARIEGDEIVYFDYVDLGMAVSTPRGLVVPVIRDADLMTLPQLEAAVAELARKARNNQLTVDDLTGGTFSITNGGVFGSMLSTPILNYPQSAILGLHRIVERPVAVNGEVVIRPIMYVALSYDHRLIDGREAVSFLFRVKELMEDPGRLLLGV